MSQLQTVANALDILTALGKSEGYLSVEQLANTLNLPESTTYRLIQTLEAKGFVERHSRKNIGLGYSLLNLTKNIHDRLDKELSVIAKPFMEKLMETSGETVILSIPTDIYSKCIKSISSKYIIRFVPEEDRLLRLDIGASSKAILAYESPHVIQSILNIIISDEDKDKLLSDLENIRQNGYAISSSEYDMGAVGIGVPIFSPFNKIYASLAIVGPDTRVKPDNFNSYIDMLKEASRAITDKLKSTPSISLSGS